MSDEDFAILLRYMQARIAFRRAEGDLRNDEQLFLVVLQHDCNIGIDPAVVQEFVDGEELTRLTTKRDAQDVERPALDAEITRLEAAVDPKPL